MAHEMREHLDKLPNTFGDSQTAAESAQPIRGNPIRITSDEIARAARELVAAYGPDAIALMQQRTRAVRRRGDAESATLWFAVAKAVEDQLAVGGANGGARADGD